jgi:hypothetical protein
MILGRGAGCIYKEAAQVGMLENEICVRLPLFMPL